jgi:hypothetical protein
MEVFGGKAMQEGRYRCLGAGKGVMRERGSCGAGLLGYMGLI